MYKKFCEEANVPYPLKRTQFGEELKSYFKSFSQQARLPNGQHVRSYYSEFDVSLFEFISDEVDDIVDPLVSVFRPPSWLILDKFVSLFDDIFAECKAQYTKADGTPKDYWANVTSRLKNLDTTMEHYVMVPDDLICIDFDIRGEDGEKDRLKNLEAASKFPETYAEYSKSGKGVHLYYYYSGDVSNLSRIY